MSEGYRLRRGLYGIRRVPIRLRDPNRDSLREALRDPTQLPIAEALRRARLQRQGLPWEPRPRYLREEYTPPEPEDEPES